MVEAAAQAIFDADNGLDGDTIATVFCQSEIADQGDLAKHLEIVRHLCRIAARAALTSVGHGPDKVIVDRAEIEQFRAAKAWDSEENERHADAALRGFRPEKRHNPYR